jgi:preprotein translocase subunit SecB
MAAAFTFDAYKLVEIAYKPILDADSSKEDDPKNVIDEKKEKQYQISVSSNTAVSREEKNKYRMELNIIVSGSIDAKITLYGYFTGTNFYDNYETELNQLNPIGVSLLLPIARSILAGVSAQDGSAPFLLPTMNVTEMVTSANGEPAEN